ncbi:MAG TPA: hypothetical protein VFR67_08340 [Pilimelia sp.]|nr:hypothetical protein [Pilimelia sp.]
MKVSTDGTEDVTENQRLRIAIITHGGAGDAFWDVIKKGSDQAGKDLGIEVEYGAAAPDVHVSRRPGSAALAINSSTVERTR